MDNASRRRDSPRIPATMTGHNSGWGGRRHLILPMAVCISALVKSVVASTSLPLLFAAHPSLRHHAATSCERNSRQVVLLGAAESASETKTIQSSDGSKKKRPTSRSVACLALMESDKNRPTFPIRRLESDPNYLDLEARDKTFARLLLTMVGRRQGQIDSILKSFIKPGNRFRKSRENDMLCQSVLRVGAAQLLFLDVPSYAAVKETVDVLRSNRNIKVHESKIKFVNAVLRNVERGGSELLDSTSIYDNIQPWLVKEWRTAYGDAKTKLIAEAAMKGSPIFLSVNYHGEQSDAKRIAMMQELSETFSQPEEEAIVLPHGSIQVPKSINLAVPKWPGYDEGKWWVQDPSATLPALALYNALKQNADAGGANADADAQIGNMHVVDLCSAPGGKTAQLCSLGFGKVTAVEINAHRTQTLAQNMARLKMEDTVETVVADGTTMEFSPEQPKPKGVLVDAPCSATGLGSRRPDVLHKEHDLDELLDVQQRLAQHAADNLLDVGGILVYATCSLLKQESEAQVQQLLCRTDGAQVETVPFTVGEIPGFDDAIDDNGWLRVVPGTLDSPLDQCDGFFVARLRRIC